MNKESKPLKPFARSELEEPGEYLTARVCEGDEIYGSSFYVNGPGLVGYPDDQHAPLIVHPKGTWLQKQCPHELRKVSSLAHDRSTEHMKVIESVTSADAQYALLMHYYRVAGIIEKSSRRSPITLDEEVAAYNMFQQGASVKEVAEKLNKNFVTIWRLFPKKEVLKYHHLNKYLVQEIHRLHALKTPSKEIARQLDLPERTVRYHLYEKKK